MFRSPSAGKSGDRQVGSAPEKMHRAALADKARTKLLKETIGLHQRTPKAICIHGVVRAVGLIPVESDSVWNLVGLQMNIYLKIQLRHLILKAPVKRRDALRVQWQTTDAAVAGSDR